MAELLAETGIALDSHQLEQLWQYHQILRKRNPELNLTRIHNFRSMVHKLYADSILPGRMRKLPGPLMDLGSGPGMPGIPLKIAYPDLEIWLAESRSSRNEFLGEVCKELGLSGLEVLGQGISPGFNRRVAGVITRALESVNKTLDRIDGCLEQDGLAIFMKGPNCDPEIEEALRDHGSDYDLIEDRAYQIGATSHQRRLVVFKRKSRPSLNSPTIGEKSGRRKAIESKQNDTFKELKKLLTAKGIRKTGKVLVAGPKQVEELIEEMPDRCLAWIGRGSSMSPPEAGPQHLRHLHLAPSLFDRLDMFGTRNPLLLLRLPELTPWDPSQELPTGCTLLVPFQDPENVGAVIRSAVAFGVSEVVILKESAYPFHPKAVRASSGAVFKARLKQGPGLRDLPDNLPLVTLSPRGRDLSEVRLPDAFALLPGMEGPGLPERWRPQAVSIKMRGQVESINAATATAIALYVWSNQQSTEGMVRLCPPE